MRGISPNAFGSETMIRFGLHFPASISLVVTDALGREVRQLLDQEFHSAGVHVIRFDAGDLRPGMYFYRLSAGEILLTGRMLLL
ncbi:MAG: T9SS type A sorting domain-containing protein, partial [Bacteroidota bacterium]